MEAKAKPKKDNDESLNGYNRSIFGVLLVNSKAQRAKSFTTEIATTTKKLFLLWVNFSGEG